LLFFLRRHGFRQLKSVVVYIPRELCTRQKHQLADIELGRQIVKRFERNARTRLTANKHPTLILFSYRNASGVNRDTQSHVRKNYGSPAILRLGNLRGSRSFLQLTQAIYYDPSVKFPTLNAAHYLSRAVSGKFQLLDKCPETFYERAFSLFIPYGHAKSILCASVSSSKRVA
jgi:hypothetical protein